MAFNGEIYEIMSWLPAKPLYKLTTIAKSSMEFLSETPFVEKQCRNSSSRTEESLIIQEDSSLRERVKNLKFCFLHENRSYNGIPKKSIKFLARKGRIIASSNGLVLCRTIDSNKPTELFLCNPVTRTWLPIKLPSKKLAKFFRENGVIKVVFLCGNFFGVPKKFPLDYTLLFFTLHDDDDWNSGYDVFLFEEGGWIRVQENLRFEGGGDLSFDEQVCCKDGLYFLSESLSPYVFHYDVKNGTSRTLPLPLEKHREGGENEGSNLGYFRLFGWEKKEGDVWFESICLVKCLDMVITIWVLENNTGHTGHTGTTTTKEKKTSSWSRVFTIHMEDDLGIKKSTWTNSFTILGKDLIFANSDGLIFRYCLQGKNRGNLDMICNYGYSCSTKLRFNSFSTTLRPCLKNLIKKPFKIK
ncbi:uncharacterized protein [Spinacia oleracea]|uniref:F-box associated domain-containing protein n=1 Tax=Spinacia oleracea TaxID=3562 RepID=A0A9R0IN03_SPIOL|nr:uncharacterized protein LOC110791444 [Spinacia oleracea]